MGGVGRVLEDGWSGEGVREWLEWGGCWRMGGVGRVLEDGCGWESLDG